MPTLGELFPDFYRQSFSTRSIVPGSVFRTFTDKSSPPKIKIFVVLVAKNGMASVASLFVNTEINASLFPSQELQDLHIPLFSNYCDFLKHDSFLDCSQIKEMSLDWLQSQIENDPGVLVGTLDERTLSSAINKVKKAPTISRSDKRKFLQ